MAWADFHQNGHGGVGGRVVGGGGGGLEGGWVGAAWIPPPLISKR
jgi:hypothetical protein